MLQLRKAFVILNCYWTNPHGDKLFNRLNYDGLNQSRLCVCVCVCFVGMKCFTFIAHDYAFLDIGDWLEILLSFNPVQH